MRNSAHVLDALLREPYAAAILDAHLAPVDGLTVCRRVRAATATPVILLLMRDDVPERIQARQVGASAMLYLPFEIGELVACVSTVLRSAASPEDQARAEDNTETGDAQPRVLLAVASQNMRATLRALLEEPGYPVVEVADGVEAFDLLLLSPTPLVVVLDLLLPRLSGRAVLLLAATDVLLMARHAFALLGTQGLPDERLDAEFTALVTQYAIPVLPRPVSGERLLEEIGRLWARVVPDDQEHASGAEPT